MISIINLIIIKMPKLTKRLNYICKLKCATAINQQNQS